MKILLIGGSKSGKSDMAQEMCRDLAHGGPLIYWATMIPTDREDRERISAHIADRAGMGFTTWERGANLLQKPFPAANATILFDSVTAYLANEMFGTYLDAGAPERAADELRQLSEQVENFVCVCDELWREAGPYGEWTERYREGLAHICRRLAARFDRVIEVSAGIGHVWKGREA